MKIINVKKKDTGSGLAVIERVALDPFDPEASDPEDGSGKFLRLLLFFREEVLGAGHVEFVAVRPSPAAARDVGGWETDRLELLTCPRVVSVDDVTVEECHPQHVLAVNAHSVWEALCVGDTHNLTSVADFAGLVIVVEPVDAVSECVDVVHGLSVRCPRHAI